MAYIDGFEHDIFISYAHVDDLTASKVEEGWVTSFIEHLKVALGQRFGKLDHVKIWRDKRRLEGNQDFDKIIEESVKDSAIFLALTSRGYHESTYCPKELAFFHQKASAEPAGLEVEGRRRIFNVRLYNIPFPEWLEEVSGTVGFPFFVAEDQEDDGAPLESKDIAFKRQLKKLVAAIHNTLTELRELHASQTDEEATVVAPADQPAGTVFLADVPRTLRKQKRRIIKDLKQQGIRVVADVPPPYEETEHDRRVIEVLKEVALSVHLLNASSGEEIDGKEDRTYPQQQVDLAIKHAHSQMIWVPRDLDTAAIVDEPHRDFLQQLKRDENVGDFIEAGPADITRHILDTLEALRSVPEVYAASNACLLVTHMKDTSHVFQVADMLSHNGIEPYINQEANEPKAVLSLYEERLKQVANLIIFFGTVSRDWVLQRLETAIKMSVLEDFELNLGVFVAPPPKPPKEVNFNRGFIQVHILADGGDTLSFLERTGGAR